LKLLLADMLCCSWRSYDSESETRFKDND